jgi:hypothetical protein
MAKKNQKKPVLNVANMYALAQLDMAHKAVMACARLGLTVLQVRLQGNQPTLEVKHNLVTQQWVTEHKAFIYMHQYDANEILTMTAQRLLCGCRIIFSFPRQYIN